MGDKDDPFCGFECILLGTNTSSSTKKTTAAPMILGGGVGQQQKNVSGAMQLSSEKLKSLHDLVQNGKIAFCISGDVMEKIARSAISKDPSSSSLLSMDSKHILLTNTVQNTLKKIVPMITVFARHTPYQKEAIVAAFNANDGYITS